jgi:branched-chain amino acid transport system permease protein
MLRGAVSTSLLALTLTGCSWVDADEARICRSALPALEPGRRIEVTRTITGPEPHSVRVDYVATSADRRSARFAVCRFAPDRVQAGKAELIDIVTPEGPLGGARTYLLRHYYLETPEGAAGDPGPADRNADLTELRPTVAYGLEQFLVGLPRTAIYALIAAAYALVFGLVGRINLAFGEIAAIGAAAAGLGVAAFAAGGFAASLAGLAVALLLAILGGALHAAVTGEVAFGWIRAQRSQASLIATVGLSLSLMEYLRLAGGAVPHWIPALGGSPIAVARAGSFIVTLTPVSLATSAIALAAALALIILMRRSGFGRAWRAQAQDGRAAALFGIDPLRVLRGTLLIAGALAGLAGGLVAIQYGALGFADGFQLGLKALAAALLGGVGSVGGALIGGLAIGAFETLWSAYLPIDARDLALYLVLIGVIVLRPNGFAGCQLTACDRI